MTDSKILLGSGDLFTGQTLPGWKCDENNFCRVECTLLVVNENRFDPRDGGTNSFTVLLIAFWAFGRKPQPRRGAGVGLCSNFWRQERARNADCLVRAGPPLSDKWSCVLPAAFHASRRIPRRISYARYVTDRIATITVIQGPNWLVSSPFNISLRNRHIRRFSLTTPVASLHMQRAHEPSPAAVAVKCHKHNKRKPDGVKSVYSTVNTRTKLLSPPNRQPIPSKPRDTTWSLLSQLPLGFARWQVATPSATRDTKKLTIRLLETPREPAVADYVHLSLRYLYMPLRHPELRRLQSKFSLWSTAVTVH